MLIKSKTIFSNPGFLEKPYGWVQHIPFAFFLMEKLRPNVFTELGTHIGNSYFSFCQAAQELKLNTKCYAVDSWEGDEHSGFYGIEVYERVRRINAQNFPHFSHLLKMKFDDALSYFRDGSIDLLHIDGLHTYEAVKHDFLSWLPKMSHKGIIVLHDTNVRNRGFGVWKLFEEVRDKYPSFEFLHSHGLGVLCVGKEVDKHILDFVDQAKKDSYISQYFAMLGQRIFAMQESRDIRKELQEIKKKLNQNIKDSDSLSGKVADLQRSGQSKQEEVTSLSDQLNKTKAKLRYNEEKLEELQRNLDNRQEILLTKELKLKEFQHLLVSEQDRVKSMDKRNMELQNSLTTLEKANLVLTEGQEDLQLLLKEREEQLNSLKEQNDRLSTFFSKTETDKEVYKRKNEHLEKELEGLKITLKQRDEKIAQFTEHQASAKARIEKQSKNNDRLEDDLKKVQISNQRLKQQLKKKEAVLQAIIGSTSWRITRPVRYFSSLKRSIIAKNLFLLRVIFFILTFRIKKLRREARNARYRKVINRSAIFDKQWYLRTYSDVRVAGADPVNHYVRCGASEERDPSPDFSTEAYLNNNPDVTESGLNPLVHYILFGKKEGRLTFKSKKNSNVRQITDAKSKSSITKTANGYTDSMLDNHPYHISEEKLLEKVRAYNKQKNTRKAKVVVYTAIIGSYDALIIPETIVNGWDYVLYTDNIVEGEHIFDIRKPPLTHQDPTRVARYIKMHPHILFSDYHFAVWIDSNILVRGNHLITQVNKCLQDDIPIMINPHPTRKTLKEELEKCKLLKKDDSWLMEQQVLKYFKTGYPDKLGLFETNILLRNIKNAIVNQVNNDWWNEIESGSRRDQLSLPYVLWKNKVGALPLPNMKDIRQHSGNDYCLFNHKGQKRNRNTTFYTQPGFLRNFGPHEFNTRKPLNETAEEEKPANNSSKDTNKALKLSSIRNIRRKLLEGGFVEKAYDDLYIIHKYHHEPGLKSQAAWELALWHANKDTYSDYKIALKYIHTIQKNLFNFEWNRKFTIIEAECHRKLSNDLAGKKIINDILNSNNYHPDLLLGLANFEKSIHNKLSFINDHYRKEKAMQVDYLHAGSGFLFNGLKGKMHNEKKTSFQYKDSPLVSIIMPAYNASSSISAALKSLTNQTYQNIEIIVVDDHSTDNTVNIVESVAKSDYRIRLVKSKENQGPYVCRNIGLKEAKGDLVTCNDADDWSHPEKIEFQAAELLKQPDIVANVSQCARVTNDFSFHRRGNPGNYIQINISSLMFRRKKILQYIGYWDNVRFGADTEMYKRLINVFGKGAVLELPPVIMSFVNYSDNTLTSNTYTAYPGYPIGARKEYRDSYLNYFKKKDSNLKYSFSAQGRLFPVPKIMEASQNKATSDTEYYDYILVSDFRKPDINITSLLETVKSNKPHLSVGMIQLEDYNYGENGTLQPSIRNHIDGTSVRMLVYGEKAITGNLIIIDPIVIQEEQIYLPSIRAKQTNVLFDAFSLTQYSLAKVNEIIERCSKNTYKKFGSRANWCPTDNLSQTLLVEVFENGLKNNKFISQNIWKDPFTGSVWKTQNHLHASIESSSGKLENPNNDIQKSIKKVSVFKEAYSLIQRYFVYGFYQRTKPDLERLYCEVEDDIKKREIAWLYSQVFTSQLNLTNANKAIKLLQAAVKNTNDLTRLTRASVLMSYVFDHLGYTKTAKAILQSMIQLHPSCDLYLAAANLESSIEDKLTYINEALTLHNLKHIRIRQNGYREKSYSLFQLCEQADNSKYITRHESPKVSVIIPAYNAEHTISIALESIIKQTWTNLEIIVSDDASTDGTVNVVKSYQQNDKRIKLIQSRTNSGPYVARNLALEQVEGLFVTCNDADDWSHPEKIEIQANHLLSNPDIVANTSQLARITDNWQFSKRGQHGFFIQFNTSSLMFRRKEISETIGFWDSVRFGADGEFLRRIINVFGKTRFVHLKTGPLSFTKQSADSLTGNSFFGYNGFKIGARKEYIEHHEYYYNTTKNQYYKYPQYTRPFPVPKPMLPAFNKWEHALKLRHIPVVIMSDFRKFKHNNDLFNNILALCNENKCNVGLIQVALYETDPLLPIDYSIREKVDGDFIQMLVYGEEVTCDVCVVINPNILKEKQRHLPKIKATDTITIVSKHDYNSISQDNQGTSLNSLLAEIKKFTLKENVIYAYHPETFNEIMKLYVANDVHIIPHKDQLSGFVSFIKNKLSTRVKNKSENGKNISMYEPAIGGLEDIITLDANDLLSFKYENSKGIIIIMPCTDKSMGTKTAQILLKRAGIRSKVFIAYDSKRQGFIKTMNTVYDKTKAKYVVYLAQDAYPGRDWLLTAYNSMNISKAGLLAFNDGKWKGKIASFGMVRTDWVNTLYGNNMFFPDYHSHGADNELTVIARATNSFVYNPESTLLEYDFEKDKTPSKNKADKELFVKRFLNGFDGLVPLENLKYFKREYNIKN